MALTSSQQAIEHISRAKHILVVTSDHPTIDALSAAVAVGLWLKGLNKTFDIVASGGPSELPFFLSRDISVRDAIGAVRAFHVRVDVSKTPLAELMYDAKNGALDITLVPKHGSWSPQDVAFSHGQDRYDLVIALGTPDAKSLGILAKEQADFLYRTTVINVDHHAANEHWGQINLVNPNAISTTECLFHWFDEWNKSRIDTPIATALLAGMIAETKGFRTPNVTPQTLAASASLMSRGAEKGKIHDALWRTRSVGTLKLWGRILSRLEQDREIGLVWAIVSDSDVLESGGQKEMLDGVVDELISYAPEAKVVMLISQEKNGISVSLHASSPSSAADIARTLGGQGTRERATATLSASSLQEGANVAITRVKDAMRLMKK